MSRYDLNLRPDPQTRISETEAAPKPHRLIALWRLWRARVKARRALAAADDRTLRDAGISPALAEFELSRPFWRPLPRHDRG
jgi:uncharacterized protein YjiS (DUF1127 family)